MIRMTTRPARAILLFGAAALLTGLLAILGLAPLDIPRPLALAVVLGVTTVVMWLACGYWRSIDEAARAAQKWAWFWGGQTGLVAGVAVDTFLPLLAPGLIPAGPLHPMLLGGLVVGVGSLVGFAIAWTWWWIARR
jgi:hypothetical protein